MTLRTGCALALGLATLGGQGLAQGPAAAPAPSTLIVNARVVDGTGGPARTAAVRVEGDRIAAVGALRPREGERVVDAGGLVLAPGFVDSHSHGDDDLDAHPDALGAVSQGITTIVGGQDGGSLYPLAEHLRKREASPAAVNLATYAGHGTLRRRVMGEDFRREARAEEVAKMRDLLQQELDAGALGLSTGLEYDPGIYSSRQEVVDLARLAARAGGRYISHLRSEDRDFWPAVEEIVEIGREAKIPVQISHLKLAMRSLWGSADKLTGILDRARASGVDVTADIYPYLYWQSTLTVLFPKRDFESRETAELVLREVSAPEGLLLGRFAPEPSYAGMTVADIAKKRGTDPAATLMALIREALAWEKQTGRTDSESVIGTSMSEPDLEKLMAWPHTNFCTDGQLDGRHPRGFGSYPRVLGRYVRDRKVLSLEDAIKKMSGLAAAHVGLRDRGLVAAGQHADLVLFDPATILDRATTSDPQAVSTGVRMVWVNGQVVFDQGASTGRRPGRVLRRAAP